MFPERQEFKDTLPKLFCTFKNIRALVDCTEFKCEMPRNYSQQGNLYSSYTKSLYNELPYCCKPKWCCILYI